MDFKQLLDKIMECDQTIRSASIFDIYGIIKEKVHRHGLELIIDEYDTAKLILEAASSWNYRKDLDNKLGKGHYAMTVYDNLIRITIPLDQNYFILVSQDKVGKQPQVVNQIQKVLETNNID